MSLRFIQPDWPAPARVKAYVTQHQGGVSKAPYTGLNLAMHVGDIPERVLQNRQLISEALMFPSEPIWLNQTHSITVIDASTLTAENSLPDADGSWTHLHGKVLAVLTADCLPILLTDRSGSVVMALHAGWRGLAEGIIQHAIASANLLSERLMAWVGPGIGFAAFEVGSDVRDVFLMSNRADIAHFKASREGHWFADLAGIALWQLEQLNVCWLGGGHWCTFDKPEQFFSYRREGITGRMASFIWLE